jgi:hypothetical protein
MQGIYDTLKECACISKSAGGIGLSIHNIRAVGSYIRGTNGTSNGIVPMLRVFNDTARCSLFSPSQSFFRSSAFLPGLHLARSALAGMVPHSVCAKWHMSHAHHISSSLH